MKTYIKSIINKTTKEEVCLNYDRNKALRMHSFKINNTVIQVGKPLKIVYEDGVFFTHEQVISVNNEFNERLFVVETTKKMWFFEKKDKK